MHKINDLLFWDRTNPYQTVLFEVKQVIVQEQTQFQYIQVFDIAGFGKCLILDSDPQSSEFDEALYHEALVLPSLLTHPNPKQVFIAGGGEGGTLREVLKFPSVERVVMAEIDKRVVEIAEERLGWAAGSYSDPRVELHFQDAALVLSEEKHPFDCILVDATSPEDGTLSKGLFSDDFYTLAYEKLNRLGLLATQAQSTHAAHPDGFINIVREIAERFDYCCPYHIFIPFYSTTWGFCLATKGIELPMRLETVTTSLNARGASVSRITIDMLPSMFELPPDILSQISNSGRVVKLFK